MKKLPSVQLCALAVLAVVNIIGANLALMLRLPLYLDSIGTMAAGALFGPLWGAVTGAASALLNGVTTDPYALYYLPVQLITGALAGVVFQKIRIVPDVMRIPVRTRTGVRIENAQWKRESAIAMNAKLTAGKEF